MVPLWKYSSCELASLIARGEVTSREVVQAHLSRIDQVNGYVNAVTLVMQDEALGAADAVDRKRSVRSRGACRPSPDAPLLGVPFTIKENIDCVGSPTTHGVPALRNSLPWEDAPVVARLKAAGAIPLARTNLPELALRLCTDNPLHGLTRNPWNGALTAGGSSGGEAAALATGMTPLGVGNDLGGSLRGPAYCCGVAALKPTLGRVPRAASIPPLDFGFSIQSMAVDGPMARTVADLRLGLAVLAGRDIRDPRSVDALIEGPEPAVRRVALVTSLPGGDLPPATVDTIEQAGHILARHGWEVELAEPPELARVTETWLRLIAIDFSVLMPSWRSLVSPRLYRTMMDLCGLGGADAVPNSEVHAVRSGLIRLWSQFLARYPVMVGPTWARLPWPIDADLDPDGGVELLLDTIRFITPGNVLGLPAVALPTGVAGGLATGIQIYADLWREDLCLQAAETIEGEVFRATPIDPVK